MLWQINLSIFFLSLVIQQTVAQKVTNSFLLAPIKNSFKWERGGWSSGGELRLPLQLKECPYIPKSDCCLLRWSSDCVPKHCYKYILANCPDRKNLMFKRNVKQKIDLRRSPNAAFRGETLVYFRKLKPFKLEKVHIIFWLSNYTASTLLNTMKHWKFTASLLLKLLTSIMFQSYFKPVCGTAELGYRPCTSRGVADKLFQSCCNIYAPKECRSMCAYETDKNTAREMVNKSKTNK